MDHVEQTREERWWTEERTRTQARWRRVLVVEDDLAQRELLVGLLVEWGYQPLAVALAEEAENASRRRRLDAAIVDVFLPDKSGVSLFSVLRDQHPDAVLIGISGRADAALARRCKGVGADLFLGKPIEPEALATALQSPHLRWH